MRRHVQSARAGDFLLVDGEANAVCGEHVMVVAELEVQPGREVSDGQAAQDKPRVVQDHAGGAQMRQRIRTAAARTETAEERPRAFHGAGEPGVGRNVVTQRSKRIALHAQSERRGPSLLRFRDARQYVRRPQLLIRPHLHHQPPRPAHGDPVTGLQVDRAGHLLAVDLDLTGE